LIHFYKRTGIVSSEQSNTKVEGGEEEARWWTWVPAVDRSKELS